MSFQLLVALIFIVTLSVKCINNKHVPLQHQGHKVQCKKFKSFLLCTVYRPPNSPITFPEDIEKTIVDSLLLGTEVIIIGDLNCNLQGNCPNGRALSDFCSTFNLTQLVKEPTRVTNRSQTLIDVVLEHGRQKGICDRPSTHV